MRFISLDLSIFGFSSCIYWAIEKLIQQNRSLWFPHEDHVAVKNSYDATANSSQKHYTEKFLGQCQNLSQRNQLQKTQAVEWANQNSR